MKNKKTYQTTLQPTAGMIDWYKGHNGVPQLNNVSARFHCRLEHAFEGGDHIILLGIVEDYDSEPQEPLVFFQGDYRQLKI